jgi:type IV secretion system protein TrbH
MTMRTLRRFLSLTAALFLTPFLLAGCASTELVGNFVPPQTTPSLNRTMAYDTVKRLVPLYPPASTRFNLAQATPDSYGTALVEFLRAKGYAILEFKPGTQAINPTTEAQALPLRYVLDAQGSELYRVMVSIGPKTLSRAYTVQNNTVTPAGAWAMKE